MTILQLHTNTALTSIDSKVERMKQLQVAMKPMQEEYDSLKKELVGSYFNDHSSYTTKSGLIVASYKPQIRESFNQTRFKLDHEELFFKYREKQEIFMFLLK